MEPEGAHRRGYLAPIALGAAICGVLWLALGYAVLSRAPEWGFDLVAYLGAADRLRNAGTLYQAETLKGAFQPGAQGLYLYAPPLGVAIQPLAGLEFGVSAAAWYVIHVLVLGSACALMPVAREVRLLAFAVAAVSAAPLRDLFVGNVSVLLLLPLAAMWRWLDRPAGSVALAVGMTVRPTLGLFLVWSLLRRRYRAVAWTVGAGLVLIAVTLPIVGVTGYGDYLAVLGNVRDITGMPANLDLPSTAARLGLGGPLPTLVRWAGYALGVVAMLVALRRDREVGFMVTLGATLLISPLLWDHYLAALVVTGAFLAARGRPWGLVLPLLTWLPAPVQPLLVVAATLLPFTARAVREPSEHVRGGVEPPSPASGLAAPM